MKAKKSLCVVSVIVAGVVSLSFNPAWAADNPWMVLIRAVQLSNSTSFGNAIGSKADLPEEERRQVERVEQFVERAKTKVVDEYAKLGTPIALGNPYEIVPLNTRYCVLTYTCLISKEGRSAIESWLVALLIQAPEVTKYGYKYRYNGMAVALTCAKYQQKSRKDLAETFEGRYGLNIGPLENFERLSVRKLQTN
jgi:hypothetical protein